MVVVVIVGVLAAIGIAAFRERIIGTKSTEALAMIQSIRAAEERNKAENLTYRNVSQEGTWYPSAPKKRSDAAHLRSFYNSGTCEPLEDSDNCRWRRLNPAIPGPVTFGYKVNAGLPSEALTDVTPNAPPGWTGWPPNTAHWYVIQAVADADGDGVLAFFFASSLRGDIASFNDGE
jgi:Tfp pilus assembly major pilin PilA